MKTILLNWLKERRKSSCALPDRPSAPSGLEVQIVPAGTTFCPLQGEDGFIHKQTDSWVVFLLSRPFHRERRSRLSPPERPNTRLGPHISSGLHSDRLLL